MNFGYFDVAQYRFWILDFSENGPSTQEDSLTLALSQREREGVSEI